MGATIQRLNRALICSLTRSPKSGAIIADRLEELEQENALLKAANSDVRRIALERDDADDYIRAIWRKDLLPSPLPERLFDRLIRF